MKKLIAILALMAMGPVAMAQFTVDTSVAGEATVSVPNGVLGLGLDVTVSVGTLDSVEVNGFNVFIDEAWQNFDGKTTQEILDLTDDNADGIPDVAQSVALANVGDKGVAAVSGNFAICAGYLAANNPGTNGATIVFKAADGADVILSENVKRGGVVNAAGKVNLNADPEIAELAFTIEAEATVCKGDMNGDGAINFVDLGQFKLAFGKPATNPAADFNGDGVVNFVDLGQFKLAFGKPCN